MGHEDTDPSLIALLLAQCNTHGFSPFLVKKNSIGYIYNRYSIEPTPFSEYVSI